MKMQLRYTMFLGIAILATGLPMSEIHAANSPLSPIRTAQFRYSIKKSTFEKNGTDYRWREEEVCSGSVPIDVFDSRQDPNGSFNSRYFECESRLGEQTAKVGFGGLVSISKGELFPKESETDVKVFNSYLYVSTPGQIEGVQEPIYQTSWTRDLNQKSTGLILRPPAWIACMSSSGPRVEPGEPSQSRSLAKQPWIKAQKMFSSSGDKQEERQCQANIPEFFYALVEFED
jgi:hypothetical protein